MYAHLQCEYAKKITKIWFASVNFTHYSSHSLSDSHARYTSFCFVLESWTIFRNFCWFHVWDGFGTDSCISKEFIELRSNTVHPHRCDGARYFRKGVFEHVLSQPKPDSHWVGIQRNSPTKEIEESRGICLKLDRKGNMFRFIIYLERYETWSSYIISKQVRYTFARDSSVLFVRLLGVFVPFVFDDFRISWSALRWTDSCMCFLTLTVWATTRLVFFLMSSRCSWPQRKRWNG